MSGRVLGTISAARASVDVVGVKEAGIIYKSSK